MLEIQVSAVAVLDEKAAVLVIQFSAIVTVFVVQLVRIRTYTRKFKAHYLVHAQTFDASSMACRYR